MENVCKKMDVRLLNNEKKFMKLVAKPNYVSHKIFNENLVVTSITRSFIIFQA